MMEDMDMKNLYEVQPNEQAGSLLDQASHVIHVIDVADIGKYYRYFLKHKVTVLLLR
jgi:hypothetical protein